MKPFKYRRPLRSGLDSVGPFHPYLAFAAVILIDLAALVIVAIALVAITDVVEDFF